LIQSFIQDYEELYGRENLTYNLHAHLHLPFQAINFGPINKISAFPFEGMFKNFRKFFHGTQGFASQITKNLALEHSLYFNQEENINSIKNIPLISFIKSIIKYDLKTDLLTSNFTTVSISDLKSDELILFDNFDFANKILKQTYTFRTSFGGKYF
jgi:hypothetical protein